MKFVRREATDIGHIDRTYLASVLFEFYFYVLNKLNETLIYLTHRIKVPNSEKH